MKSEFKNRVFRISEAIVSACFFVGVFALLVWAVYTGGIFRWLRDVFSIVWPLPAIGSIFAAATAFHVQRDRSTENYVRAKFEEISKTDEPDPERRGTLLASYHSELSGAEVTRWESASRWWMLAAGCVLASLFMLAVTAWRCVHASP